MASLIRMYRPEDLPGIVNVINAADMFDQTQSGASIEEVKEHMTQPGMNPTENVFVAEDDGVIVAYIQLYLARSEPNSFRTWFEVHPTRRGRGLEGRLLARAYARAEERIGEVETAAVNFHTMANATDPRRIEAIERFGLLEIRRFWRMVRPNLEGIAEPRFPAGLITRAYLRPDDDVAMHGTDTEVFRDHWGHADQPFEAWQHYIDFVFVRPEISVIAQNPATGEIAGFCMLAINDEENRRLGLRRGWIDILGVRRAYRRHGLGTALLLKGLQQLRDAGCVQAALGCDSENLTGATRIYERVGFGVDRTRIAFSKPMRVEHVGQAVQGAMATAS